MNNRLSKLTLAILSASTMGAAFPSLAQETPESEASDAVEVIEVRGIASSIAESARLRCRIARIRDGFMKSEGNQRTWHNMPRRPERRACRRHKTEEPHRCIFTSEVPDGKRAVVHKAPDRRFQEQSSNAGLESLINCVPLSLVVRSLTSAFATSSLHHQMPISAHPSCS